MGAPRTFPRIIEILKREAGKAVTVQQIAEETGLTETQVRSGIVENRNRVQFWHDNITVLSRGQSWTLQPSAVARATAVANTTSAAKLLTSDDAQVTVPKSAGPRPPATVHGINDGSVRVTRQATKRMKVKPKPQRLAVGELLEVIGYAGQDILARAEESGQVYRVSEL